LKQSKVRLDGNFDGRWSSSELNDGVGAFEEYAGALGIGEHKDGVH